MNSKLNLCSCFYLFIFLMVSCKDSPINPEPEPTPNPPKDRLGTVYSKTNSPLPSNQIERVAVDRKGKLWISLRHRIVTLTDGNWNTEVFMQGARVFAFDNQNKPWISTNSGELFSYNGKKWIQHDEPGSPSNNKFDLSADVSSLAFDSSNNLWVGTDKGLFFYDKNHDTWKWYYEANSNLKSNSIYDVAVDAGDKLWLTTGAGSISSFDGKKFSFFNFVNYGYDNHGSSTLLIDSNNKKWMNPSYKGIVRFNVVSLQYFNKDNSDLPGYYIETIALGVDDDIWAAYPGIYRNDYKDAALIHLDHLGEFTLYTMENSDLPDNFMHDIATDQKGNVWVATDQGLFKLNIKN